MGGDQSVPTCDGVSDGVLENPALAHALHRLASSPPLADAAARATRALGVLLEGVRCTPWREVAWRFSTLTGDHFPVELAFSPTGDEVRYTSEVTGPEVDEGERLAHAERLLLRLGAVALPEALSARFHQMQSCRVWAPERLRYGAWISGRHTSASDRYKLYVEVPSGAASGGTRWMNAVMGRPPMSHGALPELRMIGYDPASSRIEFYFRTGSLSWRDISLLLAHHELAAREAELRDLIGQAYDRPMQSALLGSRFGFSCSVTHDGQVVLAIFIAARTLAGGDGDIRQRVLALAERHRWALPGYSLVTEPLIGQTSWLTHHGLMSFIVGANVLTSIAVGVRPPIP